MSAHSAGVRAFHEAFGHPIAPSPTLVDHELALLRYDLISEELGEYATAALEGDVVEIADALGDMLYVIHGAALVHGIDLDPVFAEIQRSNMSKLGADGKPIYRKDGKILKGPGYSPPNLRRILEAQGWAP